MAGEGWEERVNHLFTFSFTSFTRQVVESYEEVCGKLMVLARSFREEIYEDEKVSLDVYPSGGTGSFEVST